MYILRHSKKMSAKHTNHARDDILAISTASAYIPLLLNLLCCCVSSRFHLCHEMSIILLTLMGDGFLRPRLSETN